MLSHRKFVYIAFLASLLVADGFVYENARFKRHIKCSTKQFQCNNEECIEDWNQCDGVDNCGDGSDETAELCGSLKCPPFSFKCAYGACIYSDLKCNGVKNCYDNSDEEGCPGFLRLTPEAPIITSRFNVEIPTGNDCVLPKYPHPGKWIVVGMINLLPGYIVPANSILLYSCSTNYKLMPREFLITCIEASNRPVPKCVKTCPSLFGNNMTLVCSREGSAVSCDNPYEGTRAIVRCTNLYEVPSEATGSFRFCNDGSWGNWQLKCEQVCGLKSGKSQELDFGSKDDTKDVLPWNVVLYKNIAHICGGTLITLKLVLTAAHCVDSNSTETYLVAAGKYYRALDNTNDDQAQYSKISNIIIHEDYQEGFVYFAFDVAVVVLANPFKFTKYVFPVCLDLSNNFDMSSLINKVGIVVGWGFTQESGNTVEHVTDVEVKYKTKDKCTIPNIVLRDFIPDAPDKLCAGLNQGISPCKADDGGGFVFQGDNGLYFLRGIRSEEPRGRSSCDEISLYTSVQYHVDFIEKLLSKKLYRDNSDEVKNDCVLPKFPDHGRWSMLGGDGLQPGQVVNENTILLFSCETNYKLMPELSLVFCNKTWSSLPRCVTICPTLPAKNNIITSCTLYGKAVSCEKPYEDTLVTVSCADFYEDRNAATLFSRHCPDGYRGYWLPNCEPVCGLKSAKTLELGADGKDDVKDVLPWNVGIYKHIEHICAGTLIAPKLVLTAAHCVDSNSSEIYLIAAGKYYRALNNSKDDQAQYSQVYNIIIHGDYNDGNPYFAFDVAVVVLAHPFKITKYVMPVCLDFSKKFDMSSLINKVGNVASWGFTPESGNLAQRLEYMEVEYKVKDKCTLPSDFSMYYLPHIPDKLCAGRVNQGKSACRAGRGGGLVFPGDNGRYFLRGIVSVGPKIDSNCDAISLYTSVQYHVDFIEQWQRRYHPIKKLYIGKTNETWNDCALLPTDPDQGRWSITSGLKPPLDATWDNTTLLYNCRTNYQPAQFPRGG